MRSLYLYVFIFAETFAYSLTELLCFHVEISPGVPPCYKTRSQHKHLLRLIQHNRSPYLKQFNYFLFNYL